MIRSLFDQRKVVTVEVLVPLTAAVRPLLEQLRPLQGVADAVNIPSNPLGRLRPDALSFGHVVREDLGLDVIPHFVGRHYTLMAFQSTLLGARLLGIENILCVTGDTPSEGRSVFELNSSRMLAVARDLRKGLTSARSAIEPVDFCLCASFNPNVMNPQGEFVKALDKRASGAEVFFTQPVFQPDAFVVIAQELRLRHPGIRIMAGLSFLHTKKRAFALTKYLGIPYAYITEIGERDEAHLLLGIARAIAPWVDGFYIVPIGRYDRALDLARQLRGIE